MGNAIKDENTQLYQFNVFEESKEEKKEMQFSEEKFENNGLSDTVPLVLVDFEDFLPFIVDKDKDNGNIDISNDNIINESYKYCCNITSGLIPNNTNEYRWLNDFCTLIKYDNNEISSRNIINYNYLYNLLYNLAIKNQTPGKIKLECHPPCALSYSKTSVNFRIECRSCCSYNM